MPEMPDKDLDKLFQLGSEQGSFEYEPDDWLKMEELLDKNRRRRRLLWWFFFSAGFVVLLAGLWQYSSIPDTPEDALKKNKNFQKIVAPKPIGDSSTNDHSLFLNRPSQAKNSSKTQSDRPQTSLAVKQNKSISFQEIDEPDSFIHLSLPTIDSVEISQTYPSNPAFVQLELPKPAVTPSLQRQLLVNPLLPVPWPPALVKPEKLINYLVASLDASLELTSVGKAPYKDFNWKAGLSMEKGFLQRFSFGLGVQYTRKHYTAAKGEYKPPYGFWTRKIAPVRTTGHCDIIEASALLRFYARGQARSGFYLGAGAVSYFLLNEHYRYSYDQVDTDLIRYWGTGENISYGLAMGQANIGYQKNLGGAYLLRVEPYFQLPLNRVGHGKVQLYSAGVSIRLGSLLSGQK